MSCLTCRGPPCQTVCAVRGEAKLTELQDVASTMPTKDGRSLMFRARTTSEILRSEVW